MTMWKLFPMFVSWGPFDYGHQTMKSPPLVTEWNINFTEKKKKMNEWYYIICVNLFWTAKRKKKNTWNAQGLTEDVFLTLGWSRSSHFKKWCLWPKTLAKVEGIKFCKFCPRNSFCSPNSEEECIKYNFVTIC